MKLFATLPQLRALEAQLAIMPGQQHVAEMVELAWHLRQRDSGRAIALAHAAEVFLKYAEPSIESRQLQTWLQLLRAEVACLNGQLDLAESLASAALTSFEALGHTVGCGDCHWLLAVVSNDRGLAIQRDAFLQMAKLEYRAAGDNIRLAIAEARSLADGAYSNQSDLADRLHEMAREGAELDPSVEVWICLARAVQSLNSGQPGNSILEFQKAQLLSEEIGLIRLSIISNANACAGFSNLGDQDAALALGEQAVQSARLGGWPNVLAPCLRQCACVLIELDRLEDARLLLEEAMVLLGTMTGGRNYGLVLEALGKLELNAGNDRAALAYFEQCEEVADAVGDRHASMTGLNSQAKALSRLGQAGLACAKIEEALTLAAQLGSDDWQIEGLRILAEVHRCYALPAPQPSDALSAELHYLEAALTLAQGIPDFGIPADLHEELAKAYAACDEFRLAYQQAEAAAAARTRSKLVSASNRAIAMRVRNDTDRMRVEAEQQRLLARAAGERAELLQAANSTLNALSLVGQDITANLELSAIFQALEDHVHSLLDVTAFAVYMLHRDGQRLTRAFAVEAGQPLPVDEFDLVDPHSLAARCARERIEIALEPAPGIPAAGHVSGTLNSRSLLFVPLLVNGKLIGVMAIQSTRAQAFQTRERLVFQTLCAYAAIALDHTNGYRQLEATLDRLRQAQIQLELMSLTDPLTGMRNRRFLQQHIESDVGLTLRRYQDWRSGPDSAQPLGMDLLFFMVDIDHFKDVNDKLGHVAGDQVLMQIHARLREVFRSTDYLVRWGGEEFLIVARQTSRDRAAEIAAKIIECVSRRSFDIQGHAPLAKTCSVGFASFPLLPTAPAAVSWGQVAEAADQCLYMAKRAGRNTWLGVVGADAPPAKVDVPQLVRRLYESELEGFVRFIRPS
jgi:diguanylate cyclase (GGDEF)-like protein